MISPRPFHPWHDIPAGSDPPRSLTAVIEIPANDRNKYELDKELGVFRLDRVLYSSVRYPGDYGFIPRTLAEDNDPMDVLVLMTEPVFTGCLVEVRPVGMFQLVDRGENDEKIIAVPLNDPFTAQVEELADLPQHALREIEHFFRVYKDLEGGRTETGGFTSRADAERLVEESMVRYQAVFPSRA
jgi:inorganic pyrophosphatase